MQLISGLLSTTFHRLYLLVYIVRCLRKSISRPTLVGVESFVYEKECNERGAQRKRV